MLNLLKFGLGTAGSKWILIVVGGLILSYIGYLNLQLVKKRNYIGSLEVSLERLQVEFEQLEIAYANLEEINRQWESAYNIEKSNADKLESAIARSNNELEMIQKRNKVLSEQLKIFKKQATELRYEKDSKIFELTQLIASNSKVDCNVALDFSQKLSGTTLQELLKGVRKDGKVDSISINVNGNSWLPGEKRSSETT